MKKIILLYFLFVFSIRELKAEDEQPTLFFSLGSHCEIANMIGHFGLRHTAGPLDWLLTLDYDCFLLLLENDFEGLVDERFLTQYPDNHVINSYYNIDFRHDWSDLDFEKNLPEVQSRLGRRAHRILELKQYEGKVYFIRGAFDVNINPNLPTITKECKRITPKDAEKIRDTIQRKYPNLDFVLVILNYIEEFPGNFGDLDKIIEFKISNVSHSEKEKGYKKAIDHIISITSKG